MKPGVLLFYRIMAYVTAIGLLALCGAMVFKYLWPEGSATQLAGDHWVMLIGTTHGFLYIVYLFVAFVGMVQLRARFDRMLLILLAGTIPFGAFFAERRVTRWQHLRLEGLPIHGTREGQPTSS